MYDLILHTSPEPMFIYNIEDLRFLEVNDAALKLYGYSREDFLQMDLTDLYAPEDIQTLIESSTNQAVEGVFTGPWRHKKSDGNSVLVEISKTTMDFEDNRAHLNIVRDVTEHVELEKKIQIFKATFESTNNYVFLTDRDGFLTYANSTAMKSLGYSKSELEKKPFISIVADGDRGKVNSEVFQKKAKEKVNFDAEVKKSSGSIVKVELSANPILDYSNEIDSYNITLKPKSTGVEKEEGAPGAAEGSSSAMDAEFLGHLFHELLTPINVIIGFAQELGDSIEEPTEEQIESVEIIRENQKLLRYLMDVASEYAALENSKVIINNEKITFVDSLDQIIENTKKLAQSNKIEIGYGKISSSLSLEIDKQRLITLISLFVEFAVRVAKERNLFISAKEYDDEYAIISLRDMRDQITPELNTRLSEIFTEDENTVRRNYGISRFTLRLARKIIQLFNGRVETVVKGEEDYEFGVLIPIKPSQAEPAQTEEKEAPQKVKKVKKEAPPKEETKPEVPENEEDYQPRIEMPPASRPGMDQFVSQGAEEDDDKSTADQKPVSKTESKPSKQTAGEKKELNFSQLSCLYVEDQLDSQILFKVQMKDLKQIEFATSFENALPIIKSKQFDFIVMDMNLQGEYNGLDALRFIQKLPGYENTPIIAVTAYVLPGDREKFIAAGFRDFISKPILRDKLTDVLKLIFS
ncbi:MAG: PAS domain S-box protein [Melioribacteraceae bacterium]|nr:PAS domain S-box protein [Melioribacteraceae bacterium]